MKFPLTWHSQRPEANCSKLQYDPETRVLHSTLGGNVYQYEEVPPEVMAAGLMLPNNKVGSWHAQTIVKGGFRYELVRKALEIDTSADEMSTEEYMQRVARGVRA